MLDIANLILPVFALIALGFLLRRTHILSARTITELNRFVIYLALPALNFDIILNSSWEKLWQPGFILTFEIAVIALFIPVLLYRWWRTKDMGISGIEATAASYANTGYIGIPLCLLAFGPDALEPALIAAILTISLNFALSIVVMETSSQKQTSYLSLSKNISLSLIKNPLIISPIVAGILLACGIKFPGGISSAVNLLGAAACPCALVATGLFLAQKKTLAFTATSIELIALKLIVQPAIAWYLAFHVFDIPQPWAKTVVILSALPTGTGPFMLAELYRKGADIASRTILLSTIGSIVTLFFWLNIL